MTTKQERAALQEGDLHRLLSARFPDYKTKQGIFDVPAFADSLSMSAEGVYKWLRADKLSPEGAKKIIALQAGRKNPLTQEDLFVFVLR